MVHRGRSIAGKRERGLRQSRCKPGALDVARSSRLPYPPGEKNCGPAELGENLDPEDAICGFQECSCGAFDHA
jgi:hypothetical protein